MKDKWYNEILYEIINSTSEVLLIVDRFNLLDFPEVRKKVKESYPSILEFRSEIELRKKLRDRSQKTLVVFDSYNDIPFDLENKYASIEVKIENIECFKRLDKSVIQKTNPENYQAIYEKYIERFDSRYQKLNEKETERLVEDALDFDTEREREIREIKRNIEEIIQYKKLKVDDFGKLSELIGRYNYLQYNKDSNEFESINYEEIEDELKSFIKTKYEDLMYDIHKNLLNSQVIDRIWKEDSKTALICLDGMGFEEWNVIYEHIMDKLDKEISVEVQFSISLLPTTTTYSRLSLFSGMSPKRLKDKSDHSSLNLRDEAKLFNKKLKNKFEISDYNTTFQKQKTASDLDLNSLLDSDNIGIVLFMIDDKLHNQTDKKTFSRVLRIYLKNSGIENLIKELLDNDYQIWICSDHGNVYSKGNGKRISKDLTEERAKRCGVFDNRLTAKDYDYEKSEIIKLEKLIGEEYLLLLTGDEMFETKGKKELTHGGISLQEIFVPLVKVSKDEGF